MIWNNQERGKGKCRLMSLAMAGSAVCKVHMPGTGPLLPGGEHDLMSVIKHFSLSDLQQGEENLFLLLTRAYSGSNLPGNRSPEYYWGAFSALPPSPAGAAFGQELCFPTGKRRISGLASYTLAPPEDVHLHSPIQF
ncbi:Cyclin-Dependent Kinase 12 [Manis pentadactyla]|nr:Cyclin-Dependent Kinase 12 [Manis pentadactyla]